MTKNVNTPVIERIMKRVVMIPLSGCWIFTGALNEAGYGMVGLGGRGDGIDRVHRIMYREHVGDIPAGLFVCHRCDVRSCCNPHHLFAGTNAENMRDCRAKGRASTPPRNTHLVGESHYASKMLESDIKEIRRLFSVGEKQSEISRRFKINSGSVNRIVKMKSWKHIK